MEILYRDEYYVAFNKPAGLLVHRSDLDRHETRFALQTARDLLGCRVFPVHRLDRPTSGVLLFALSAEAAGPAGALFAGGEVYKTYLAAVRGVTEEEGIVDHPLREQSERWENLAAQRIEELRPAVTRYRRLGTAELQVPVGRYGTARYSLVEVNPLTGRRHQIRRHLKHIFHPIIGDTNYGDGLHNRLFRREFDCRRLLLASVELSFTHPFTGEKITIRASLDQPFRGVVDRLGWRERVPSRWLRRD